jgi:DNA-binding transcriptional LysR family regulator
VQPPPPTDVANAYRHLDNLPRPYIAPRAKLTMSPPELVVGQQTVRLRAPAGLGCRLLMPRLHAQSRRWRGIRLDNVSEHHFAEPDSLVPDVSLVLGAPETRGLQALLLGSVTFRLYAAPMWNERLPQRRRFIAYEPVRGHLQLLNERIDATRVVVAVNSLRAAQLAGAAEVGMVMLPGFMAGRSSLLERTPDFDEPLTLDLWGVVHPQAHSPAAARLILDLVAEVVTKRPRLLG